MTDDWTPIRTAVTESTKPPIDIPFRVAFGAIIDGSCPRDGGKLQRRPNWGYAFCSVCGEGWLAFTGGEGQGLIRHYPQRHHDGITWTESGHAWTKRRRYL